MLEYRRFHQIQSQVPRVYFLLCLSLREVRQEELTAALSCLVDLGC